jgi:GNAT superfamily N-acetyltransferase
MRDIEAAGFACWPALETREVAGWLLRFGGGHTKRANSANPLRPGAAPEVLIPEVEMAYRQRGLPPIFRLTPLADVARFDEALAARSYRLVEPSRILVLEDLAVLSAASLPAGLDLSLDPRPGALWCAANDALRLVVPEERAARDALLQAIAVPAAFGAIHQGGTPLAVAIGAVSGGWFHLNALATAESARRRGLMRALIAVLGDWARRQGASTGQLAVVAGNAPAEKLYEGLGYREFYRYHYRVGPS